MLEDVEFDQQVVSSAIISSPGSKVVDNIFEVLEPELYHNNKDKPMYDAITE